MNNRLAAEASPYLRQHQHNPVEWYPWGDEAFRRARELDRPIFLSVGYSTCHWCHVMAHESFEDVEIAEALNPNFVCIKVDREERPDVDNLYMKALQALSGGGGWPMSVWLTPDGHPFFAGTYFPKYRFGQLLRRIEDVWKNQREALLADGERFRSAIAGLDAPVSGEEFSVEEQREFLKGYTNLFQYTFDEEFGGFGGAPKFPQTMNLRLMMRRDFQTGLRQAETLVTRTLEGMVRGGMRDHLRGGFHRYSVDKEWTVPHFEKMLYDQAMITETLLEAHCLYGESQSGEERGELAAAARGTLDFVLRELSDKSGGFYAALDADSKVPGSDHAEEGFFATFTHAELRDLLTTEEFRAFGEVYDLRPEGHLEGRIVLRLRPDADLGLATDPLVTQAKAKCETRRAERPGPHLDDKIIVAWNGWMIVAFLRAGHLLSEPRYLRAGLRALTFIKQNLWIEGRLRRFYGAGGPSTAGGTAEDYASLIAAGIAAASVAGSVADRADWVTFVRALERRQHEDFWDEENGGYFTDDGRDPNLPARTKDEFDGVTPGANSQSALNLWQLWQLTGEDDFRTRAERLFARGFATFKKYPSGLPYFGLALDFARNGSRVVVSAGAAWITDFVARRECIFDPYTLWTVAESGWPVGDSKPGPALYMCEGATCLAPARSEVEALALFGAK